MVVMVRGEVDLAKSKVSEVEADAKAARQAAEMAAEEEDMAEVQDAAAEELGSSP